MQNFPQKAAVGGYNLRKRRIIWGEKENRGFRSYGVSLERDK